MILEIVSLLTVAIHVGECTLISPVGRPPRAEARHALIDPVQPALAFPDDARLEGAVAVPGYLDLDRADLGEPFSGDAVPGVLPVAAHRVVLVIAQVVGDLGLEGGLQDRLGQPGQQPPRGRSDSTFERACSTRARAKYAGSVRVGGDDRLGHCWSFPAKLSSACRPGSASRCPDSPAVIALVGVVYTTLMQRRTGKDTVREAKKAADAALASAAASDKAAEASAAAVNAARTADSKLEVWRQREETMRMVRWGLQQAASPNPRLQRSARTP